MTIPTNLQGLTRNQRASMPRWRSAILGALDEEKRTVTLSFASQEPCPDFWGDMEVLRCDDAAMVIQRFTSGIMPVLYNHNRDALIGKPTRIWTENQKAYAEIEFARTDEADKIMGLAPGRFLNGVSVGYRVQEWTAVRKDEVVDGVKGPAYIAQRWEVFEISLVTVPADATVGVGRSMFDYYTLGGIPMNENQNPERQVPQQNPEPKNPVRSEPQPEPKPEPQPQARQEPTLSVEERLAAERKRTGEINALCGQFGIDDAHRDAWIADGTAIDAVRSQILNILGQKSQPHPARVAGGIDVGESEVDKKRELYAAGYLLRCGIPQKEVPEADKYRNLSMMDIAREMLSLKGERDIHQMDPNQLFQRAMTTTALPLVLNDITKASLLSGYQTADVTYDKWAYIGSVNDFREHHGIVVGLDGER